MNRINFITFRFAAAFFVFGICFAAPVSAQTPQTAPTLPAGMTGSDIADPRFKLSPGLYDAGEAAMGIKHLTLLKKPNAFQLGSDDPDSPNVKNNARTAWRNRYFPDAEIRPTGFCPTRIFQLGYGVSGQPLVYGKFLRCQHL